jgi:hypothetical protein
MKECYECGKELRFWESYRHPILGREAIICSKCFVSVEKSRKKYCNFILKELKQQELKSSENILNLKSKFYRWWNNLKITHY